MSSRAAAVSQFDTQQNGRRDGYRVCSRPSTQTTQWRHRDRIVGSRFTAQSAQSTGSTERTERWPRHDRTVGCSVRRSRVRPCQPFNPSMISLSPTCQFEAASAPVRRCIGAFRRRYSTFVHRSCVLFRVGRTEPVLVQFGLVAFSHFSIVCVSARFRSVPFRSVPFRSVPRRT